jgi:N-acetylmuramoyl-L-alanine amidase
LLASVLVVFLLLTGQSAVAGDFPYLTGRIVLLDPGHAVRNSAGKIINPGAGGKYIRERDVVLRLSEILGGILAENGAKVYYTRRPENPWRIAESADDDNRQRAEQANSLEADVFLRLHCDWSQNRRMFGITTYYYRDADRRLAGDLQATLSKEFSRSFRKIFSSGPGGGHFADFGVKKKYLVGFFYSRVPAVLIETGYLTNARQEKWLTDEKNLKRLARTISSGLNKYFLSRNERKGL